MDWEERYRNHGKCFGETPSPFFHDIFPTLQASYPEAKKLLFPGDGYGRNGIWAAQQGYEVEAFDLSPTAVAMGEKVAAKNTYSTRVLDPCRHPWPWEPNSFDGICLVWCRFEDVDKRREVNAKLFESLRPGGFILIISSTRVMSFEAEQKDWPSEITWCEHIKGDDIRMIGYCTKGHDESRSLRRVESTAV